MRFGVSGRLGPLYASQRIGLPRRRYRRYRRYRRARGGGGNLLGWLVVLAFIGWLTSQCDGQTQNTQPTQITRQYAPPITTTVAPKN